MEALGELESTDVDAILFSEGPARAAGILGNVSARKRRHTLSLGLGNWSEGRQLDQSKQAIGRVLFVSPFYLNSRRSEVVDFDRAFQSAYQQRPDFFAAQGFDLGKILLSAAATIAPQSNELWQSLLRIDISDLTTGESRCRQDGEFERSFAVVFFSEGSYREIKRGEKVDVLTTPVLSEPEAEEPLPTPAESKEDVGKQ